MASTNLGIFSVGINTASLSDGASIAAYLTSAAGNLITDTQIGSKFHIDAKLPSEFVGDTAAAFGTDYGAAILAQRNDANTTLATADGNYAPLQLDANGNLKVSGTITITDNAEYAEDSPFTDGDIGLFTLLVRQDTLATSTTTDGDFGAFKSNALGELYVHDTSALAELVLIKGDTASIVTNTGNTASNTSTISATLSALSKAEDAVAVSGDQGIQALAVRKDAQGSDVSNDGDYSSLQTWSEGSLKVVDVANGSLLQQRVAVGNTATLLPTSSLASRKNLIVQNAGSASFWVGSATVTASGATAGIEVPKGGDISLEIGPAVSVYAITASGSINANVLEMA